MRVSSSFSTCTVPSSSLLDVADGVLQLCHWDADRRTRALPSRSNIPSATRNWFSSCTARGTTTPSTITVIPAARSRGIGRRPTPHSSRASERAKAVAERTTSGLEVAFTPPGGILLPAPAGAASVASSWCNRSMRCSLLITCCIFSACSSCFFCSSHCSCSSSFRRRVRDCSYSVWAISSSPWYRILSMSCCSLRSSSMFLSS